MKEHSLGYVTEEQRRYGQKDQDLVCYGFSGNDTNSDPRESDSRAPEGAAGWLHIASPKYLHERIEHSPIAVK